MQFAGTGLRGLRALSASLPPRIEVYIGVVPFFGCQLGKIPARGDLFDHLHDPQNPGGY